MVTSVGHINTLLSQFQTVNSVITQGTASGADITDALDQRATILQGLSKEIGITTVNSSNGGMAIYTDSGVTLFETTARTVTMAATTYYSASTTGASVYVDGVPVTGANAVMPIQSGALAGLAELRDTTAPEYQSQLDSIASATISAFAELDSLGSAVYQGLFTYSQTDTDPVPPASTVGLAGLIGVNANASPPTGSYTNIRDGVINPNATSQNASSLAGFNTAILAYVSGTGSTSSLSSTAADSASWLNAQYQTTTNDANYKTTLLSQASQALSNASGVNIDSQLSMMLEYENSYQASAKLISTINTMFGAILQAVSA